MWPVAVFLWFLGIFLGELAVVSTAAHALGLALALILCFGGLALASELDALAVLLLATYTGVFIFLALLALHFGPYHQPSAAPTTPVRLRGVFVVLLALFLALVGALSPLNVTAQLPAHLLVCQDMLTGSTALVLPSLTSELQHLVFFCYYTFETVLLNLYLLAALAAAVAMLVGLQTYSTANNRAQHTKVYPRLRLLNKQRRQARRRNSSAIRHTTS